MRLASRYQMAFTRGTESAATRAARRIAAFTWSPAGLGSASARTNSDASAMALMRGCPLLKVSEFCEGFSDISETTPATLIAAGETTEGSRAAALAGARRHRQEDTETRWIEIGRSQRGPRKRRDGAMREGGGRRSVAYRPPLARAWGQGIQARKSCPALLLRLRRRRTKANSDLGRESWQLPACVVRLVAGAAHGAASSVTLDTGKKSSAFSAIPCSRAYARSAG